MSRIDELIAKLCPDGVEFKPLGECIKKNTGGGTPSRAKPEFWRGDIPWASVGELSIPGLVIENTRQSITAAGLKGSSSNLIHAGDVIVAVKISPGRMKIAGVDMAINQDLRGLSLKPEINNRYITYYFQTINVGGSGTIVKAITNKTLEKIRVPVPPLEIQKEIVNILDKFTQLEAELEAELEARKKQYEFYRNHLLNFDESGGVLWKTLGEIGKVSMCKRILKHQTTVEGDIPFYKIGTFGKAPDAYIPQKIYEDYRNRFSYPKKGDVLLSASGTIGRTVVYDGEPAYFQDSNIIWLDNDEKTVTNKYLFHVYKIIKWRTEGGAIQRLYNDNLKKIKIAVPPITEQNRIVAILDRFDKLTTDISEGIPAEIAARRKQYEYYRNKLLTFNEVV